MTPYDGKILIVDDDPAFGAGLAALLDVGGLTSTIVSNIQSAQGWLAGHVPDLVLTDFELGTETGVDLARRIREEGKAIPVIVMSAVDLPSVEKAALKAGAEAFVRKDVLVSKLQSILMPGLVM